jgi:predicted transposase YbfD/YdcC
LHLVSAWATENQLSLGQVAVNEKSNEITAIPALLEMLELKGALVSIDAMGTQGDCRPGRGRRWRLRVSSQGEPTNAAERNPAELQRCAGLGLRRQTTGLLSDGGDGPWTGRDQDLFCPGEPESGEGEGQVEGLVGDRLVLVRASGEGEIDDRRTLLHG